jgi:hypothetical protein
MANTLSGAFITVTVTAVPMITKLFKNRVKFAGVCASVRRCHHHHSDTGTGDWQWRLWEGVCVFITAVPIIRGVCLLLQYLL